MPESRPLDAKAQALRQRGALHAHPTGVTDELFRTRDFFDARDLVQVKYEMLRRVRVDGRPVASSAAASGLSRPTYYQAQEAFDREGLPGLLPRKRGPRGGHKVTPAVLAFLVALAESPDRPSSGELVRRVQERWGVRLHPRTVERALARRGKARR
jgi:hypothetical protein